MTPTMKSLGIDQLTLEQRITLALEIWESLGDARPGNHLTTEELALLSRRDAELDANPEIGITWEHVRAAVEH